jgi:hypothetical protein
MTRRTIDASLRRRMKSTINDNAPKRLGPMADRIVAAGIPVQQDQREGPNA